jgi:hypothetical protein
VSSRYSKLQLWWLWLVLLRWCAAVLSVSQCTVLAVVATSACCMAASPLSVQQGVQAHSNFTWQTNYQHSILLNSTPAVAVAAALDHPTPTPPAEVAVQPGGVKYCCRYYRFCPFGMYCPEGCVLPRGVRTASGQTCSASGQTCTALMHDCTAHFGG